LNINGGGSVQIRDLETSRPLQKPPLVVAAVYDRRDLLETIMLRRRYRAFAEVSLHQIQRI